MNNKTFKKVINYIKDNKEYFEISRFDGDIFWLNHLSFLKLPVVHIYLYLKSEPKNYRFILNTKNLYKIAQRAYKIYEQNPGLFKGRFYQYRDNCYEHFCKLISSPKIDKKLYSNFVKSAQKFAFIANNSIEGLDRFLGKKIELKITDEAKRKIATTPLYMSYVQQREEQLLKNFDGYKKFKQFIIQYRKEWGWSFLNFASHKFPSQSELLNKALELLKNKNEELNKLKKINKAKIIKQNWVKKLPSRTQKLIEFFDIVVELRDQRKAFWLQICAPFKNWLKKIVKDYGLSYDDLRWLTWDEQCRLSNKNKKKLMEVSRARRNGCSTAHFFPGKTFIFVGKEYEQIKNLILERRRLAELKGISVSAGKITGRVKNILSAKDFNKFKKDEILVASHTAPDYVPIMKKAKAILTERGGIACHAAIISRELGVPCIVGIKGLVGNFDDGDLIEVDANKGVVKIIKKARQ